jgi:hypothetical protein
MSNVDQLFAKEFIPEGTVVLTEEDLPDCELYATLPSLAAKRP